MGSPSYVVDADCNDLRATVLVNDWLCYRALEDGRFIVQQKLNSFLFEGRNEIRVLLSRSATAKPGGYPPAFELRLLKGEHGGEADEAQILFHLRWEPDELPLAEEIDVEVEVLRHEWTMVKAFGRWGWQDAVPYMPPDRSEVVALVMAAHRALGRRDLAAWLSLIALKNEEIARSIEAPAATHLEEYAGFMRFLMDEPDFTVAPLDPARLELTTTAGGKLVVVRREGGASPLRIQVDDLTNDIDLTVSRIGREFTIVR
jgi:hypothetical protein